MATPFKTPEAVAGAVSVIAATESSLPDTQATNAPEFIPTLTVAQKYLAELDRDPLCRTTETSTDQAIPNLITAAVDLSLTQLQNEAPPLPITSPSEADPDHILRMIFDPKERNDLTLEVLLQAAEVNLGFEKRLLGDALSFVEQQGFEKLGKLFDAHGVPGRQKAVYMEQFAKGDITGVMTDLDMLRQCMISINTGADNPVKVLAAAILFEHANADLRLRMAKLDLVSKLIDWATSNPNNNLFRKLSIGNRDKLNKLRLQANALEVDTELIFQHIDQSPPSSYPQITRYPLAKLLGIRPNRFNNRPRNRTPNSHATQSTSATITY